MVERTEVGRGDPSTPETGVDSLDDIRLGTAFGPSAGYFFDRLEQPSPELASQFSSERFREAREAITILARASELAYAQHLGDAYSRDGSNPKFEEAHRKLHAAIARGDIEFIDEEYALPKELGIRQVELADTVLGRVHPETVDLINRITYDRFTPATMTSGREILRTPLQELLDPTNPEKMPWVALANVILGHQVRALLRGQPRGEVRIVDVGGGTGATTARIGHGIVEGLQCGEFELQKFAIEIIESNKAFADHLRGFTPEVEEMLREGLPYFDRVAEPVLRASVRVWEGNATELIGQLDLPSGPDDLTIFVAAYSMHRIPTAMKRRMFGELALKKGKSNVMWLMIDLDENGSLANVLHFNRSPNGVTNIGNRGTEDAFRWAHFHVHQLDGDTMFDNRSAMGRILRSHVDQERYNDGKLRYAYRGPEATRLTMEAVTGRNDPS